MSGDRATDARSELAHDTLLSLAAISIVGGSAVVYNVVVGRFLGGAALGYAGLALAVGIGVAQLATAGLAPATTRFTAVLRAAGHEGAARRALIRGTASAAAVGCGAALLTLATADLWSEAIGLPAALVWPTVALIALQSGYLALKAGLYGVGRVGGYARSELAAGLAFAGGLVALLATGADSSWMSEALREMAADSGFLLTPFVAANLVFVVLAVWYLRSGRAPRLAPRLAPRRDPGGPGGDRDADAGREAGDGALRLADGLSMPRYATIAWIGSAAAMARVHLAVLGIGLRWPATEVGLFQAGLALTAAVLLVPRAVELALFPSLSRSYGRADTTAFRRQLGEMLTVSVIVLAATAGGLIVAGPALLVMLYGPEFAGAQAALDGVVVSAWLLGLAVPAIAALSSANAVSIPNAAGVLGLLTSVALWLWLVPNGGAAGAAVGLAAGSLVTFGLPMVAARRLYGLPLAPSAAPLLRSLLLLAVAVYLTRVGSAPIVPIAILYAGAVVVLEWRGLAPLTANLAGWPR